MSIYDVERELFVTGVLTFPLGSMANGLLESRPSMAQKILLVEDNSALSEFLSIYLHSLVFETSWAGTSALGISKALAEVPDLIITDLHLPDMTGVDAATILKQDPVTSAIPIVVLTATVNGEWKHKALKAGVTEYLIKPISPQELAKVLRKLTPLNEL
jgi:two-component system phosphate regulon response regulator PhoB